MAYMKIVPIKTNTHLQQVFDYIENPDKTEESVYVSSYLCDSRTALEDFREIHRLAMKKGNNLAHHLIQSFSTEDNITPEKALEIGEEFMRRLFPDYQYVIAVHLDREHTHVHIVMNSVNFRTHKKLHSNHKTLEEMRRVSDELCAENGLIVITPEFKASRKKMKADIDKFVKESSSFDGFLEKMQSKGYELRYDKYLAFRPEGSENFFRVDTLGTAYEENSLHIRCANAVSPQNKRKQPYTKILTKPMSKAKYLMRDIDSALYSSRNFDEFVQILQLRGIDVKEGKHLSMKPRGGKRFRRVEKLGEEYTEEMLRLYFDDKAEYKARKAAINKRFGLLNKDPKDRFNRYIAVENINTRIKMMNYMSEHNIKSQEGLLSKIETAERHKASIEKELNWLNARLDREQSLVTARYYYRKNKDIYRRYEAITDPVQKETFKTENSREINRYLRAVAIMNHEKEKHGNLPTTKERNKEIEKTKQQISKYKEMLKETQSELSQLEILYENLYDMAHPIEYEETVEEEVGEEYEEPVRMINRGWER